MSKHDWLYDAVTEALSGHRLLYHVTTYDSDSTVDLLDILCPPNDTDTARGCEELDALSEAVVAAVIKAMPKDGGSHD